ncbi:S9 family peptidase [Alteromonas pelagimontana]|uniref:S9 family peptidase n=1 Tax=Alteromonas pelagimontana TaxID=1858656 RepID=A0A6M4M847_9ALTE|nr:prolyl oligopeptidase family serine peptidase [Alteromonas pelagimontana]QJR79401.1 S9 family peptidase [Alteromonas pelagimontana]
MNKITTLLLAAGLTGSLAACTATNSASNTAAPAQSQTSYKNTAPAVVTPEVAQSGNAANAITLEKIMSDPQWLGQAPENAGFSIDGKHIVFERERINSDISDLYQADINTPAQATKVALEDRHLYQYDEYVTSQDGKVTAFRAEDSVFAQFSNGDVVQLTRGGAPLSNLQFMVDGRLMAQSGDKIVAINLTTGQRQELVSWKFAEKPEAVKASKDYIAEQQVSLIQYIAKQRQHRQAVADEHAALAAVNPAVAPKPIYFNKDDRLVAASVSPKGDTAIIVTTAQKPSRDDSDIMPHYIQEDARIAAKEVRQRVADAEPVNHDIWLVNLETGEKHELSYVNLPGYNEDVLAEVKAENAKAKGESYEVNRLPRAITLLESWYWQQPSIRWQQAGNQVAFMLEAWDNKDRWIVTVDFDNHRLVNQHRLHDDAWVNYRFNQFGWLHNSEKLFFQSEQTGYAHLYLQTPGQAPEALTKGQYIVDEPTVTRDDKYVYFKANKKHPGIYEIYRVNLASGEMEAMTNLNGMTDYKLSPDGDTLLLTHSKVTRPPELYIKPTDPALQAKQITHSVSEEFLAMPWAKPQVVAIPSSNTAQPIYARVYLPENYQSGEPRRAVVFNHGAGYLQNAHLGWSGYFREFMFHSMLVQQGYVVLDMDYRASAGYGRDWRTAIYRQMGKPEVEDLRDGVDWLVANANVDRERIGTYGGSYGGFLTFMSLFTAPDLFEAGAALRPVSDWAHYNTPYTANILNTPEVDPIAYERSSPIYFAEGLEKPLLINSPMVDDNVFFEDSVRLVQRLIELKKQNFEIAIYPVERHGFVQPTSWLDEYRRIYKLFETNL